MLKRTFLKLLANLSEGAWKFGHFWYTTILDKISWKKTLKKPLFYTVIFS